MPAFANGHRYLYKNGPPRERFADPDAGWGHRSAISLYWQRTAVERGFGRLTTDCGLLPLRVRRLPRVALHVNLTILAQLASALLVTRDT